MKRTVYEAPVTELFRVELEGGFMAGSVVEGEHSVATTGHEINDLDAETLGWNDFKNDDNVWK